MGDAERICSVPCLSESTECRRWWRAQNKCTASRTRVTKALTGLAKFKLPFEWWRWHSRFRLIGGHADLWVWKWPGSGWWEGDRKSSQKATGTRGKWRACRGRGDAAEGGKGRRRLPHTWRKRLGQVNKKPAQQSLLFESCILFSHY